MSVVEPGQLARFRALYAEQRASEGRALAPAELRALPFLRHGPLARQWQVRARSYRVLLDDVVQPLANALGRPLDVLDLGAGNGWVCHRLARYGHRPHALDVRTDAVDGLGAALGFFQNGAPRFDRVCASFEALPLGPGRFDLVIFNAALHYALDLELVLREATRVTRAAGRIAIVDSPFYARERDGTAMVAEKRRTATARFGSRSEALLALPFIEFLTPRRLATASASVGLRWTRHRVRYPLWYELRPFRAALRRERRPSRFDVWEARVA